MTHIYIIGSRGLPVGYSGYETFVLKLTEYSKGFADIKYHVACRDDGENGSEYNNAVRFYVKTLPIGNAKAIPYDVQAFKYALKDIKKNGYNNAWIYILACRIGPFMKSLCSKAKKLGVRVAVNPDGHEWMRGKWNKWIKKYWKYSEKFMVKHSDLMICDSTEMERYIKEEYKEYNPKTCYLSYGSDENVEFCSDEQIEEWYNNHGLRANEYYLIVGRFIPENNYKLMISEFLRSKTEKSLVLITDVQNNDFYSELKETGFEKDPRVRFVGTVFDRPLINRIRKQAFMYFHGHEVGGTNPSLLEAMVCECPICAVDVAFSREVLGENGLYFQKTEGSLCNIINKCEKTDQESIIEIGLRNANRAHQKYDWNTIASKYTQLWKCSKRKNLVKDRA